MGGKGKRAGSISGRRAVSSIDLSGHKPTSSASLPAVADRRKPKYSRIVLKLSGEMLGGESGKGIDPSQIESLCSQVNELRTLHVAVAVVIGGGNIIRGDQASQSGLLHRATADYMGMLATIMNALALQDALESMGAETRVMSAIKAEEVCEPYIRRKALRHLELQRIVILAGGTGNPYFTTDTTAALRAMELKAEVLLKATKVSGVFDSDPAKNAHAVKYEHLSYMQVLRERLKVMDTTAVSLCMDNKLPIIVFSVKEHGNIRRVVMGERLGTLVDGDETGAGRGKQ
ncbi:MAG: UMP kinase [Planctomycetota bacterium]|nr:UMP kinase [Planctomycetota bacterium]